jgi:GT2 family glycosyltransferase
MKTVCLAILNYNGRKHLEALLPSAVVAANNYTGKCSILVLDNRSTEPDVAWIKRTFPSLRVEEAPENDFLYSYNWLLPQLQEDIVVLLNNDLRLKDDFILPLIGHFSNSDVFAVSATSRDWSDKNYTFGPISLRNHHGSYYWNPEFNRQELSHTLFTSGGFMAVDREKFLLLGGFNRLFYPAYGEDLDLCFRAWRRGWKCLFEPKSIVFHRESASWRSEETRFHRMTLRSSLLFQYSSLPKAVSWMESFSFILITMVRKLLRGDFWYLKVWFSTWMEWIMIHGQYTHLMTSKEELRTIKAELESPR